MTKDDDLISVTELALRWRTPLEVVADLVRTGTIPSLDAGRLARAGEFDVALLRPSWAEHTRVDSPGAVRRLDHPDAERLHPAASTALDLHDALCDRNDVRVWQLCSRGSRTAAADAKRLTAGWIDCLGDIFNRRTGIATGVYALVPHRGVGIRLVGSAGVFPIVYDRPTPQVAIGLIVLVNEEDRWLADLPLTADEVNYVELVRSAPPEGWSRADGALP